MPRKMLEQYPHFFDQRIRCPVLILGESLDSGCNPALDAGAKLAIFPPILERFVGESFARVPDSISGLIMGDFLPWTVSRQPLMRREDRSLRPPIFPGTFPVWH